MTISGAIITGAGFYPATQPDGLSADLDLFDASDLFDFSKSAAAETTINGARVAAFPVDAAGGIRAASIGHTYIDDYYARIHIVPNPLACGNLLSEQIQDVYVWNAYRTGQTLNSVSISGGDGISLVEPEAAPTTFAALEERTYTVTVDLLGPPTIAASVLFGFAVGLHTLDITGQRVVLWPWMPADEMTERMEWQTEIIKTRVGEQRIALRPLPRQVLVYRHRMRPAEYARWQTIAREWSHRIWGVGVWLEQTYPVSASSGASSVEFDTAYADYQEGGMAMLWEGTSKAAAVQINTLRADGIDLELPLDDDWTGARIMPLRLARTLSGVRGARSAGAMWGNVAAEFLSIEPVGFEAATTYGQYRGYDVLADGHVMISDIEDRINMPHQVFDNGQGIVEVETLADYSDMFSALGRVTRTRADRWAWRQWLLARRGKQAPFWLPSFRRDITVLDTIASGAANIEIADINLALYGDLPIDIMIEIKAGTRYYRRVSVATAMTGYEVITIDSALGVEVAPADIRRVSFMHLVRLDADSVSIEFAPPMTTRTNIAVKRVTDDRL